MLLLLFYLFIFCSHAEKHFGKHSYFYTVFAEFFCHCFEVCSKLMHFASVGVTIAVKTLTLLCKDMTDMYF